MASLRALAVITLLVATRPAPALASPGAPNGEPETSSDHEREQTAAAPRIRFEARPLPPRQSNTPLASTARSLDLLSKRGYTEADKSVGLLGEDGAPTMGMRHAFGFDRTTGDFVSLELSLHQGWASLLGEYTQDGDMIELGHWLDENADPASLFVRYEFSRAEVRTTEVLDRSSLARLGLDLYAVESRASTRRLSAVSADGSFLAEVLPDRIELVDLRGSRSTSAFPTKGLTVADLAFSFDGTMLAVATVEGGILILERLSLARLAHVPEIAAWDVDFDDSGLWFLSGDGVGHWTTSTRWTWNRPVGDGAFLGTDEVVLRSDARWELCRRDGSGCRPLLVPEPESVQSVAPSPNGKTIAFSHGLKRYALANVETGAVVSLLESDEEWLVYDAEHRFMGSRRADRLVDVFIDDKPSSLAAIALTHNEPSPVLAALGVNRPVMMAFYDGKAALRRARLTSRPTTAVLEPPRESTDPDGPRTLYFFGLAVGVLQDPRFPRLKFADDDVRDMQRIMADLEPWAYDRVVTQVFIDDEVGPAALDHMEAVLDDARPTDHLILFISGHGVHTNETVPRYYYILRSTTASDLPGTGLPFERVEQLLARAKPQERLLFLDTCNSGLVDDAPTGSTEERIRLVTSESRDYLFARDRFIFNDLSDDSGAIVLSSSRGTERSVEHEDWQNGAFTESILRALTTGLADDDGDGLISTDELAAFLAKDVPRLTGDRQHPTMDRGNRRVAQRLPIDREGFRAELEDRRRAARSRASPCAHCKGDADGGLILLPVLWWALRRRPRVAATGADTAGPP